MAPSQAKKKTPSVKGRKGSARRVDATRARLSERVKELTCLYGIAQIASNPDLPIERKLAGIARILPAAWQYPRRACARILLDGRDFQSPGFRDGARRQTAAIRIGDRDRGAVEVHYRDGRGLPRQTSFLDEERRLIDNIAGQIAFMIEHEDARAAKAELREQLIRADRLAAIGQLAAGVAHELNEPLNAVLGLAQLVRKMPGLPVRSLADLDKIVEASLHARTIIRELLVFARQGRPGRARVNLNRIIMDELALFETLCGRSCVEIRRVVDPDLPEITADKSQIRQVISNLVVNALQAMPGGGVLTLQTFFDASRVCLAVEDNGIGMSPRIRENVFMPFFTTKDVDQGTGLGLSVVHGIVSLHKGEIRVESQEGRGSRFVVAFPLHRKTAPEEKPT